MPPGMRPMGMMPPPQRENKAAPPNKAKHNPLPPGPHGLRIMQGFAKCQVLEDSDLLNRLIEQLLDLEDDEEFTEITEEAGKAIAVILKSDRSCDKHVKARLAVRFEDDDELLAAHTGLKDAERDVERLQQETAEAIHRMKSLENQRWDLAIKKFGLNPETYFYEIDEEEGTITQKDLDCNSCKGRTIVRKTRQHIAQQVLDIGKRKAEEAKNDGPTEGNGASTSERGASDVGKAVEPEQEVSGVADSTDTHDSDGGDGTR